MASNIRPWLLQVLLMVKNKLVSTYIKYKSSDNHWVDRDEAPVGKSSPCGHGCRAEWPAMPPGAAGTRDTVTESQALCTLAIGPGEHSPGTATWTVVPGPGVCVLACSPDLSQESCNIITNQSHPSIIAHLALGLSDTMPTSFTRHLSPTRSDTSRVLNAFTNETVGGSILTSSSACEYFPSLTWEYLKWMLKIWWGDQRADLLLQSTTTVPGLSSLKHVSLVWNWWGTARITTLPSLTAS